MHLPPVCGQRGPAFAQGAGVSNNLILYFHNNIIIVKVLSIGDESRRRGTQQALPSLKNQTPPAEACAVQAPASLRVWRRGVPPTDSSKLALASSYADARARGCFGGTSAASGQFGWEAPAERPAALATPCALSQTPAGELSLMEPAGEMWSVVIESPNSAMMPSPVNWLMVP